MSALNSANNGSGVGRGRPRNHCNLTQFQWLALVANAKQLYSTAESLAKALRISRSALFQYNSWKRQPTESLVRRLEELRVK
jgi:hypothetical protein